MSMIPKRSLTLPVTVPPPAAPWPQASPTLLNRSWTLRHQHPASLSTRTSGHLSSHTHLVSATPTFSSLIGASTTNTTQTCRPSSDRACHPLRLIVTTVCLRLGSRATGLSRLLVSASSPPITLLPLMPHSRNNILYPSSTAPSSPLISIAIVGTSRCFLAGAFRIV